MYMPDGDLIATHRRMSAAAGVAAGYSAQARFLEPQEADDDDDDDEADLDATSKSIDNLWWYSEQQRQRIADLERRLVDLERLNQ
ncbi:MAG: hypothetical protein ACOYBP_08870 [Microbacteriaceae bacterium]